MSKNTVFYGLLAVGGLIAYYAWKNNKEKNKAINTSTSGTFVDDVSVLEGNPITNTLYQLDDEIKKSVSIISEPIIKKNEQYNPISQLV
jgi:uncharacterized protein YjiK